MKKAPAIAMVLVLMLALGGCSADHEEAPALTVTYDGISLVPETITMSWTIHRVIYGDYSYESDVTDALSSALDGNMTVFRLTNAATITLDFASQPENYAVYYWPAEYISDPLAHYADYTELVPIGNTITLPEAGGCVFEISARYVAYGNSEGTALYRFYISE